jgi:hypothetical protein
MNTVAKTTKGVVAGLEIVQTTFQDLRLMLKAIA